MSVPLTESKGGPKKIGAGQLASTLFTGVGIQFLTIIQGAVLARWLGPEGRGQLAAAILWPTFFAGIGIVGTGLVLARKAAKSGRTPALSHTAVYVALMTGGLTTLVAFLALPWMLTEADAVTRTAALWFLPFILFNHVALLLSAVDHGAGDFARLNMIRMLVNPLYLGAIAVLVAIGSRDVVFFAGALAFSTVLAAGWRLAHHIRESGCVGPSLPVWPIFKESWPYALVGVLGMGFTTMDRALLLHLMDSEELGFYIVALSAASAAGSITGATSAISFGMSAQAEHKAGFGSLARIFRLSFCLWIFCGLGLAVVMPFLLPLIYGPEFGSAVVVSMVLIPSAALAGLAGLLEEALRAQGRAFVGVGERGLCLVLLLICGLAMVPLWGLVGMAVASVLSQGVLLLLLALAARRHFDGARLKMLAPSWADAVEAVARVRSSMDRFRRFSKAA
ncbi:MAG: oligosaccharide flippase family protein [Verrucomicrobiota bacterium]